MTFFKKIPKSLIFLWIFEIITVNRLWDSLPGSLAGNLLITLIAVNGVLLYLRQFELPVFFTVALVLVLAHLWLGNGYASPLTASLLIFGSIILVGLIVSGQTGPIQRDAVLIWSAVGLFTSQIATLIQFWPITPVQKSMLGTIIFYLVWQTWQVIDFPTSAGSDDRGRHPILWHFIFVGLAVMVVVVNIIWTTWPGLKTS